MKKINKILLVLTLCFSMLLSGCAVDEQTTTLTVEEADSGEELSFLADFYDNHGNSWLSVEGSNFDIKPNKVKEYYYDSDGDWTWHYVMSSIMSITIDNYHIEGCGSTITFSDSRLEKHDIDIPKTIESSQSKEITIGTPTDLSAEDYFTLGWWWKSKDLQNSNIGSRVVIIQSQEGDNICMYSGDKVEWDIPKNLPKTTEVTIDGMPLFIHRANFAIIDTSLLNKVGE